MKRAALGSVLAMFLAVVGLVLAGPAVAHAELESTNPADGAALAAPPGQLELVFGETPMADAIDLSITDASGAVVAAELAATVDGSTVIAPWPSELGDGAYTVNYRVVSDDGHPVEGSFSFTVGDAAPAVASTTAAGVATTSSGVSGLTLVIVAVVALAIVAVAIVLVTRRNRDDVP